jgi:hypothetical protein
MASILFRARATGTLLAIVALAQTAVAQRAVSRRTVRETQTVEGESWRLEWQTPPHPACADSAAFTCACDGLRYGEGGDLALVRVRPGQPDDQLVLTRYFQDLLGTEAIVARTQPADGDEQLSEAARASAIGSRPVMTVMHFGDYDHDGHATEFVLQIHAGACGERESVLVGIDARNRYLHVFGTAQDPLNPLVLRHPSDWEGLLHSERATNVEIACGDHGSDREEVTEIRATPEGFVVRDRVYACSQIGRRGRLLSTTIRRRVLPR